MDGRDDEVEFGQHVVRIVHRPIRQNIGLDASEDMDITKLFLNGLHLGPLLANSRLL